jgi:hypothetical protein
MNCQDSLNMFLKPNDFFFPFQNFPQLQMENPILLSFQFLLNEH